SPRRGASCDGPLPPCWLRPSLSAESLNILYLFPQLVDHCFQLQADSSQAGVVRFRAERVGLAVEFLREEVEAAANCTLLRQKLPGLIDMGETPVELLSNIIGRGNQLCFQMQPLLVETGDVEQTLDLF